MDYGYQILRHVVAQVFGNLGSAARITLVLLLIPLAIVLATNPGIMTGAAMQVDPVTGQPGFGTIRWGGLLLAALIGLVCWLWAAVAWHRFVLLEEYPTGILPAWQGTNIVNYFGNSLLILLIMIGVGIGAGLIVGIVVAIFQTAAIALLMGIGLVFALSWVATRIGLILPATAIGARLSVGESWKATAPVAGQIILPIFVIALVSAVLNQAVIALFGETTTVPGFGGIDQQQVTLSVPGVLVQAVISWLQMLVNLALMTTLYGNLVEGRRLN